MKYNIMSRSHRIANHLQFRGNNSTYKKRLSLALKVEHLRKRLITIADINWLMENYPEVNLSLVRTLYKSDRFHITGDYYLSIEQYVMPRTEQEDNHCIGVMIESEIKSGIKPNLD